MRSRTEIIVGVSLVVALDGTTFKKAIATAKLHSISFKITYSIIIHVGTIVKCVLHNKMIGYNFYTGQSSMYLLSVF